MAVCAFGWAQEGYKVFSTPSTAARRFKTWRGAERLPTVDLSLEPGAENAEIVGGVADFFRVKAGLGQQMEISDNIFLLRGGQIPGRHDRPSDILYTTSPNVHLELPAFVTPLMIDYSANIIRAGSFHEFDTEEHHLSGLLDLKTNSGFGVRVQNALARLSSMPSYPARRTRYGFVNGRTGIYDPATQTAHLLNNFWTNTCEMLCYYESPERLHIEGKFSHDLARFDARRNWDSDYDIDTAGGEIQYRILPKTSVLSEYYHEWVDNRGNSPDNERDRLGGGVKWDMTAKVSGRVALGYEWYHMESTRNVGGLYGNAELLYNYSSKLRFALYADRQISETTAIAQNLIDGGTFESTSVSLTALHKLSPHLDLTGRVFGIADDYSHVGIMGPARRDDLYGFSFGIRWRPLRWVSFGANYQHQKNGSNIRANCFEENRVVLNAAIGF